MNNGVIEYEAPSEETLRIVRGWIVVNRFKANYRDAVRARNAQRIQHRQEPTTEAATRESR